MRNYRPALTRKTDDGRRRRRRLICTIYRYSGNCVTGYRQATWAAIAIAAIYSTDKDPVDNCTGSLQSLELGPELRTGAGTGSWGRSSPGCV
jgi:hypothetical protein